MNKIKKLKKISENPSKEVLVKKYLLRCCVKLIRFRSDGTLAHNLQIAQRFLKGFATDKQMNRAEWNMEGQAFGAEHYSRKGIRFYFRADKEVRRALIKVRISKGLNNNDSRKYLTDMAYFIDSVFCHIAHANNWFFEDKDERFLCPRLFQRYFDID